MPCGILHGMVAKRSDVYARDSAWLLLLISASYIIPVYLSDHVGFLLPLTALALLFAHLSDIQSIKRNHSVTPLKEAFLLVMSAIGTVAPTYYLATHEIVTGRKLYKSIPFWISLAIFVVLPLWKAYVFFHQH